MSLPLKTAMGVARAEAGLNKAAAVFWGGRFLTWMADSFDDDNCEGTIVLDRQRPPPVIAGLCRLHTFLAGEAPQRQHLLSNLPESTALLFASGVVFSCHTSDTQFSNLLTNAYQQRDFASLFLNALMAFYSQSVLRTVSPDMLSLDVGMLAALLQFFQSNSSDVQSLLQEPVMAPLLQQLEQATLGLPNLATLPEKYNAKVATVMQKKQQQQPPPQQHSQDQQQQQWSFLPQQQQAFQQPWTIAAPQQPQQQQPVFSQWQQLYQLPTAQPADCAQHLPQQQTPWTSTTSPSTTTMLFPNMGQLGVSAGWIDGTSPLASPRRLPRQPTNNTVDNFGLPAGFSLDTPVQVPAAIPATAASTTHAAAPATPPAAPQTNITDPLMNLAVATPEHEHSPCPSQPPTTEPTTCAALVPPRMYDAALGELALSMAAAAAEKAAEKAAAEKAAAEKAAAEKAAAEKAAAEKAAAEKAAAEKAAAEKAAAEKAAADKAAAEKAAAEKAAAEKAAAEKVAAEKAAADKAAAEKAAAEKAAAEKAAADKAAAEKAAAEKAAAEKAAAEKAAAEEAAAEKAAAEEAAAATATAATVEDDDDDEDEEDKKKKRSRRRQVEEDEEESRRVARQAKQTLDDDSEQDEDVPTPRTAAASRNEEKARKEQEERDRKEREERDRRDQELREKKRRSDAEKKAKAEEEERRRRDQEAKRSSSSSSRDRDRRREADLERQAAKEAERAATRAAVEARRAQQAAEGEAILKQQSEEEEAKRRSSKHRRSGGGTPAATTPDRSAGKRQAAATALAADGVEAVSDDDDDDDDVEVRDRSADAAKAATVREFCKRLGSLVPTAPEACENADGLMHLLETSLPSLESEATAAAAEAWGRGLHSNIMSDGPLSDVLVHAHHVLSSLANLSDPTPLSFAWSHVLQGDVIVPLPPGLTQKQLRRSSPLIIDRHGNLNGGFEFALAANGVRASLDLRACGTQMHFVHPAVLTAPHVAVTPLPALDAVITNWPARCYVHLVVGLVIVSGSPRAVITAFLCATHDNGGMVVAFPQRPGCQVVELSAQDAAVHDFHRACQDVVDRFLTRLTTKQKTGELAPTAIAVPAATSFSALATVALREAIGTESLSTSPVVQWHDFLAALAAGASFDDAIAAVDLREDPAIAALRPLDKWPADQERLCAPVASRFPVLRVQMPRSCWSFAGAADDTKHCSPTALHGMAVSGAWRRAAQLQRSEVERQLSISTVSVTTDASEVSHAVSAALDADDRGWSACAAKVQAAIDKFTPLANGATEKFDSFVEAAATLRTSILPLLEGLHTLAAGTEAAFNEYDVSRAKRGRPAADE